MSRITASEARDIATRWKIPLDSDYHALNRETVERIIGAADERRYRKPPQANGSRARYFHAYLSRAAASEGN
jgi:hypothetical protein